LCTIGRICNRCTSCVAMATLCKCVAEPSDNPPGPPHTARMPANTPLAGDNMDASAACTVPFCPYRGGVVRRTQNVSEYMLVLAVCLVLSWSLKTRVLSRDCLKTSFSTSRSWLSLNTCMSCLEFPRLVMSRVS